MAQSLFRDTIFALSSGRLPSGVAVIRLSGPHVRETLKSLTGAAPVPRRAALSAICSLAGEPLDHGIVLFFDGPKSFTGEDCAEFQIHGGVATVSAVLRELGTIDGLRLAEAGEFTRRAFINGKIDLTEAEGLADLIASETEAQRLQALANAQGGQRIIYEDWRRRIVHGRAMIEAELDFADEGDVPGSVSQRIWADLAQLQAAITAHVSRARSGEIVRNGFDVVILGAPNAGKSSLMNALAGRDVSIIADEAGTTRDLVEARLDLGGYRVNLADTAGIRENAGHVESIGIKKALSRSLGCDLVLLVEDVTAPGTAPDSDGDAAVLRIGLKSDLSEPSGTCGYDLCVSAASGLGLDSLCSAIETMAREAGSRAGEATPVRQRQTDELRLCAGHLGVALASVTCGLELRAEELRLAGDALGRLTGRIDVEDLLDVIFSEFCVGK